VGVDSERKVAVRRAAGEKEDGARMVEKEEGGGMEGERGGRWDWERKRRSSGGGEIGGGRLGETEFCCCCCLGVCRYILCCYLFNFAAEICCCT
jgi:hypothetical protein